MFDYKTNVANWTPVDQGAEAPHVDNGNTARLVEVIQKARQLAQYRQELEEKLLRNQAEITQTSGLLQEMVKTMYQEDPVVKYLADVIIFVLAYPGQEGLNPAEKRPPF